MPVALHSLQLPILLGQVRHSTANTDSTSPLLLSISSRLVVDTIAGTQNWELKRNNWSNFSNIASSCWQQQVRVACEVGREIACLFCGTVPGNKIRTPQRSRWRPRVPTRDAKEENGRRPDLLGKKTLARLAAKGSVRFTVCTAVTLRQVCSFQFSDNSESE